MQIVNSLRPLGIRGVLLAAKRLLKSGNADPVYTARSKVGDGDLNSSTQFRQFGKLHTPTRQVDGSHVGDSVCGRRHDKEATPRTTTHTGNLVVLE